MGDIVNSFRKASNQLADVRMKLQYNLLDPSLLQLERDSLKLYSEVSKAYEKFLHQKSKVS